MITVLLCSLLLLDWKLDLRQEHPVSFYSPSLGHTVISNGKAETGSHWLVAGYSSSFAFVRREAQSFRIIGHAAFNTKEDWADVQQHPDDVVRMRLLAVYHPQEGQWAITSLRGELYVEVSTFKAQGFGAGSTDLARSAYLDWCETTAPEDWQNLIRVLRSGDKVEYLTLWSGYLHNTLALLAAILALYSTAWIPRAIKYALTFRTRRRLALGQCTECGYDLRGIIEKCPECGSTIASS